MTSFLLHWTRKPLKRVSSLQGKNLILGEQIPSFKNLLHLKKAVKD